MKMPNKITILQMQRLKGNQIFKNIMTNYSEERGVPPEFNNLEGKQLKLIRRNSIVIKYNKNETIFKQGEFVTKLIYIISGYTKIYKDHRNLSRVYWLLPAGHFAGLPILLTANKHVYSMSAFAGTIVCQTDINVVRDLFKENGHFAYNLIEKANQTLSEFQLKGILDTKCGNAMAKLADTLLFLADKVFLSDRFDLLLTRVELAQLTNISRENTIKALSAFHREGIIRLNGRIVEIIKRDELEKTVKYG